MVILDSCFSFFHKFDFTNCPIFTSNSLSVLLQERRCLAAMGIEMTLTCGLPMLWFLTEHGWEQILHDATRYFDRTRILGLTKHWIETFLFKLTTRLVTISLTPNSLVLLVKIDHSMILLYKFHLQLAMIFVYNSLSFIFKFVKFIFGSQYHNSFVNLILDFSDVVLILFKL